MVYVTGDTHGYLNRFFYPDGPLKDQICPDFVDLTEEDVLIVAGDFGYVWDDSEYYTNMLDRLETLPFQLCFVDGNHENFPLIASFPQEEWNGGQVHRIRSNIRHLMRGEIFEIDENTFFVFGGASSTDRGLRVHGKSWWPQELPSQEEYDLARKNLTERGQEIDYIITHTCPEFLIPLMGRKPYDLDLQLTTFLSEVATHYAKDFKGWFFGHWHLNQSFHSGRYRALYDEIIALPSKPETNATFRNFQVGPKSQLAVAMAKAVAYHPSPDHPLVLYSHGTTGKTHLLKAIRHEAQTQFPYARICCTTANNLAFALFNALRLESVDDFRAWCRDLDYLLVDDFDTLVYKPANMTEMLHIMADLARNGGQWVITLDQNPEEIPQLHNYLQKHFPEAHIVELSMDDSIRRNIVDQWAQELELTLTQEEMDALLCDDNLHDIYVNLIMKETAQSLNMLLSSEAPSL